MEFPENFFHEEERCGVLVDKKKKELWAVLLQLALEFKRVCEKYNIRYFMHAGTLLGAVRHKGFIPWDDDMDFVVMREDYYKLVKVEKEEFQYPYFFQTVENSGDIFSNGGAMLRMCGTTGVKNNRDLYHRGNQGIGIDIGILDNLPDDKMKSTKLLNSLDFYNGMMFLKKNPQNEKLFLLLNWNGWKAFRVSFLSKLISEKYLIKKIERISLNESNYGNEIIVANELLNFSYRGLRHQLKSYDGFKMMEFEGILFPAPIGYDDILKKMYLDDYMELPAPEKRKGHHYSVVNTKEDYQKYLVHFNGIFKNVNGRKIVIFGAGKMMEYYLKHTSKKYHPAIIVDNDSSKWGKELLGCPVISPNALLKMLPEERYIIICSIYYKQIMAQLEDMEIKEYYVYVQELSWL